MCQRNWRQYNAGQVQKGSLTFLCHPKMIRAIKNALQQPSRRPKGGRPPFPPQLIFLLMLLKLSYRLSYRSCEGFADSVLSHLGIPVPDYSTLCRRMRSLVHMLPRLSRRRPQSLLVDSSGFKICGEGEWKVRVHGKSRRRAWRKVHLLVDSRSNEIVDLIITDPNQSDLQTGLAFLKRAPDSARAILADGAYDGRPFRREAFEKGIRALVPPPRNAKIAAGDFLDERNDAIRIIEALGNDQVARRIWGKLTGYHHRVKVESAFARLKRLFGASLFSRRSDAQEVEIWCKALLSNLWIEWASV